MRKDSVTLSWAPPKDTGNSPITNYVVEMRPVGGFQWTVVNLRKTVAQPSYMVTGLKDETTYEFRVSAENKVGQSPPSDVSAPAKYGKHRHTLRPYSIRRIRIRIRESSESSFDVDSLAKPDVTSVSQT